MAKQVILVLLVLFANKLAQAQIRISDPIICDFNVPTREVNTRGVTNRIVTVNSGGNIISGRQQSQTAEFEVKYIGFPENAQAAVQRAIDIWASNLKSPIKIRMFINWTVLETSPNTLAFVVPTEIKNFEGSPNATRWYPMCLAEKIARKELNSVSEADIVATFNAGRPDWYFGTDGQTPAGKYDLVSVALHEIGHGLGFSGTFRVSNGLGSYGTASGEPKIYDQYIYNGIDQNLLSNTLFPNGSASLGNQLTSNSLVFKSEIAKILNTGGNYPRIYAPSPYAPGSSISHLDESTYNGTNNSLMTPFVGSGQSESKPGPLVKGMFYEMGWIHTYLQHAAIGDQETVADKPISLIVESDTTIDLSSVKIFYTEDNFSNVQETTMSQVTTTEFETFINPTVEKTVKYFFTVNDIFGRTYRLPEGNISFEFFLGNDTQPPTITHTAPPQIIEYDAEYTIEATVLDNIGINKVYVEYQINDDPLIEMDLSGDQDDIYKGSIDLTSIGIKQGDHLKYRIIALDASSNANTTALPSTGQIIVKVKEFPPLNKFISNLDVEKLEFYGDFKIYRPTGFTNGAIHSPHPYLNSTSTDPKILSYLLLHPIIIDNIGILEFDEVVLIEPGISPDFTSPEFADYVIVEASKDNGVNWEPLLDGYDSRSNTDWLTYYNSNILNGDSKAIGTLNYLRKRKIEMTPTFSTGDIVMIRFSLVSNSSKTGWGWAIDNLKIQDEIVGLEELDLNTNIRLWPNPAAEILHITSPVPITRVVISNYTGFIVAIDSDAQIDVSSLAAGLYMVKIETKEGVHYRRLIKQ